MSRSCSLRRPPVAVCGWLSFTVGWERPHGAHMVAGIIQEELPGVGPLRRGCRRAAILPPKLSAVRVPGGAASISVCEKASSLWTQHLWRLVPASRVAALSELTPNVPPELVDRAVSLCDSPYEIVRLKGSNSAGADELTVAFQPLDALLSLTSAMRAGKGQFMLVEHGLSSHVMLRVNSCRALPRQVSQVYSRLAFLTLSRFQGFGHRLRLPQTPIGVC